MRLDQLDPAMLADPYPLYVLRDKKFGKDGSRVLPPAIGALLQRFPNLQLGATPLRYRSNPVLRCLESLPVSVAG